MDAKLTPEQEARLMTYCHGVSDRWHGSEDGATIADAFRPFLLDLLSQAEAEREGLEKALNQAIKIGIISIPSSPRGSIVSFPHTPVPQSKYPRLAAYLKRKEQK